MFCVSFVLSFASSWLCVCVCVCLFVVSVSVIVGPAVESARKYITNRTAYDRSKQLKILSGALEEKK